MPNRSNCARNTLAHVQKMLELSGEPPAESRLRRPSRYAYRDQPGQGIARPRLAPRSATGLSQAHGPGTGRLVPGDRLAEVLPRPLDAAPSPDLNVGGPRFLPRRSPRCSTTTSLDDIKTYLRWHLIHSDAAFLSTPFVNENFRFFRQILAGAKEIQPRWKRCVAATDGDLGFALGQKYVEETFGAEGKARTLKMVQEIEKALGDDIRRAFLDDSRHQAAGARSNCAPLPTRSAIRINGATIRACESRAATPSATMSAPLSLKCTGS